MHNLAGPETLPLTLHDYGFVFCLSFHKKVAISEIEPKDNVKCDVSKTVDTERPSKDQTSIKKVMRWVVSAFSGEKSLKHPASFVLNVVLKLKQIICADNTNYQILFFWY